MRNNIKFSVTIPAYKEKFLKEAIDSILAQTYQNYEIVIVNDASPYDIDSIVNNYNDSRIRYYKNEKNCGAKDVVDNWNICLGYSSGDYLICMGDDDKLTPNCLQDFADLIEIYPQLDLFHAQSEIIDDNSKFVKDLEKRPLWESVYSLIYKPRYSHLGDYLFKTETLRKNGGFYKLPYGWQSDDITAFIAAESHGVANTQKVGFQYRGNSLSISYDLTCIEDKIKAVRHAVKWRLDFVKNKHPKQEEDKELIKLILLNAQKHGERDIDEMVEFDIRKKLVNRSWYWLSHHKKNGISCGRYIRCILRAISYRLK